MSRPRYEPFVCAVATFRRGTLRGERLRADEDALAPRMPGHAGSQPPPSASAGPPPGPAGTAPGGASLQAVGRRLAKESTMVIAQTVLVKGVTIISSILLARILGRDQLGLWTVVTATGGVVWVVAELGLGAALVPLIAEAKADGRRVARLQATSFLLSMVVGGMIITGYVAVTPHLATAV